MNQQQILLTQLLGSKEIKHGCFVKKPGTEYIVRLGDLYGSINGTHYQSFGGDIKEANIKEIIGHPATLSDFHRWMNLHGEFQQNYTVITFTQSSEGVIEIPYDSSNDLMEQSEETLALIIELITKNQ